MEYPKLRQNIQIQPFVYEEERGFLLKDSLIEEHTLFLTQGAAALLMLLDGTHTAQDIQDFISQKTGQAVDITQIESFIRLLDEHYFIENKKYEKLIDNMYREYKSRDARPSLMAGTGYPGEQEQLRIYLDEIFGKSNDNGKVVLPSKIRGIVAPHIDIERGKNTYAYTYNILKKYKPADTYIILGVNHSYFSTNPFIVTDRDYETPLGQLKIDTELLDELKENLDWNVLEDELAHKGEHSIEFPALFLNYIYPESDLQILPILCNYANKDDAKIQIFIETLKGYIEKQSKKVVVLASVDFSHIGPQFGWDRVVEETDIKQVEKEDLKTLQYLADNSAEEFYGNITNDGNKRNIDALGAGYILLKVLDSCKGQLIHYDQAYDPYNTVTFAGLLFN